VKTATLDERRRLVMPPECPPNASVTIQQVDSQTWIVQRATSANMKVVAFPIIEKLSDDPEWDKIEEGLGKAAMKRLRASPPEEFD
jgi:hypothetical protein